MGGDEPSFDVFFSYHWRDHAQVEAVARMLGQRGLRIFLDRWYLIPGQPWPQALERTLSSCSSVAVFLGAEGLGPWQQRERDLALDRQVKEPGFPVIPVLLTRADPALGFLKLNTWVDLSASIADEAALDVLCAAIRRKPPLREGLQEGADVRAAVCPYRGLRPFREEDAAFFCGREAFTDKLVEAVERKTLVAVVGASGIGKSSVVRAGLVPHLRQAKGGGVWEIVTLVPTDRPLHSLAAALVPLLEPEMTRVDRLAEVNKLAAHLSEGTVSLRDVAADVLRNQPGSDRLLLFVDQWEELYTLTTDDAERRRFLAEILDASAHGQVTVVLTLRGDFFGQALSDRTFADRLQDAQVNLGPMTQQELERSIVEPAEKAGLQFESGLVDRILGDVGHEPGSLPLLEFVLASLWEQRQGVTLHHKAYERMGGVQGAIATRADAEFEKLDAAQKEAARRMLVQMVRLGEETQDTRQRAVLPPRNKAALTVIRRLADARLVVTGRDAATGEETAEVTHEALIRHWTLLRTWVDADRDFLRSKARLEAATALWEREERDESRLLPAGRPLAEGVRILTSRRSDLGARVVEFIEASKAAANTERRRTLLWRGAPAAAVLLIFAVAGLYWDFYVREHEQFYRAFARRWGAFEGVGSVRAEDVAHRSRTFRFVRQGRFGSTLRMDAIDGSGNCAARGIPDLAGIDVAQDNQEDVCRVVWQRDSDGRLARQIMLDRRGAVSVSLVYTDNKGLTAELRAETGQFAQIASMATTLTFERIDDGPNRGQEKAVRFTDTKGEPRRLGKAFGQRLEYGRDSLPTRMLFLGRDDKPMQIDNGVAEFRVRRDGAANPVEYSRFDKDGNPVRGDNGVARWTLTYDSRGNRVREDYFDEKGRLTRNKDGYATLAQTYDEGGRETERAFFDEAGKSTLSKNGYARITRKLNDNGRLIEEAYFDQENKPTLSGEGFATVVRKYDSRNLVETLYLDQEGKPTRSKDGYAKIRMFYDEFDRPVEFAYFDAEGLPTVSKDGYAKQVITYDKRGNVGEEAYFDEAGRKTLSKAGYAIVIKDYDGVGRLVGEAYRDEWGNPTLSNEGYAKLVIAYDDRGDKEESYLDAAGKPTLTKSGYAAVKYLYDVQGNLVRESYYDKNGNPVRSKKGIAGATQAYDDHGRAIELAFFDELGKPTLNTDGYAKLVKTFDQNGYLARYDFFDETGKPTVTKSATASLTFENDARGNVVRQIYYDETGKRSRWKESFAEATMTYDSRDRVVERAYFDEEGRPSAFRGYHRITLIYDSRGNEIESRYLSEKSQAVRSEDGYAKLTRTFDVRGNEIEQAYFDEAGRPARSRDGYAKVVNAYNDRGDVVETMFFDEEGKPTKGSGGYARETFAYDKRGNYVAAAFFDEAGKPTRSISAGISAFRQVFDARGNIVEAHALDEAGQPTRSKDGHARVTQAFDERGNMTEQIYFDEKGNPLQSKLGYARVERKYDSRDREVEIAYFDAQGRLSISADGYAKVAKAYDARGNVIETTYFDEQNLPTASKDGYAKVMKGYDARGNVVEESYFDQLNRPKNGKSGYARVVRIYGVGGDVAVTFFDAKGVKIPARGDSADPPRVRTAP